MKTNWNEITIDDYLRLKQFAGQEDVEVEILSILTDMNEDDLLDLPLDEFKELRRKSLFIETMPDVKPKLPNKLVINKNKYDVIKFNKWKTSQFIDFMNYYKISIKENDYDKYLKSMLSTFIVPEGKQYGQYDIDDVINELGDMSVIAALEMMNFFSKLFLNSTNSILHSLEKEMRKSKIPMEKKQILMKMITRLQQSGAGLYV